jgi:hypothetical protein
VGLEPQWRIQSFLAPAENRARCPGRREVQRPILAARFRMGQGSGANRLAAGAY